MDKSREGEQSVMLWAVCLLYFRFLQPEMYNKVIAVRQEE